MQFGTYGCSLASFCMHCAKDPEEPPTFPRLTICCRNLSTIMCVSIPFAALRFSTHLMVACAVTCNFNRVAYLCGAEGSEGGTPSGAGARLLIRGALGALQRPPTPCQLCSDMAAVMQAGKPSPKQAQAFAGLSCVRRPQYRNVFCREACMRMVICSQMALISSAVMLTPVGTQCVRCMHQEPGQMSELAQGFAYLWGALLRWRKPSGALMRMGRSLGRPHRSASPLWLT